MEYTIDTFDWEFYINEYKDLRDAGILTKKKAWLHWCNYGCKENRINRKINNDTIKYKEPHTIKNIIISSTQYPGYGGAATNAYELIKFFRKKGYNVCGVFFDNNLVENFDPDNIGGIYMYTYKHEYENIRNDVFKYFNGTPEICLAKNYLAPQLCKKIFGCYTVYLVSGINHFRLFFSDKSGQEVLDENFKIDPNWINKNEVITNTMADKLICNSKITNDIFKKIYPQLEDKLGPVVDTTCISRKVETSYNKTYDIAIVCSILTRKDKNNEFLINILKNSIFNKYKKIIVGKNNEDFLEIPNTFCTGILSHHDAIKVMSHSKILLFPSLFDSNSNTVREAYYHKCLPLITKNIGFYELFPEFLICNSYTNEEWISKILNILVNYDKLKNVTINYCKNINIKNLIK
jgi:glycosyltransferase involved in cell wall biosynthesis